MTPRTVTGRAQKVTSGPWTGEQVRSGVVRSREREANNVTTKQIPPYVVEILVNTEPFRTQLQQAIRLIEEAGPVVLAWQRRREAKRVHTAYRARKRGRW